MYSGNFRNTTSTSCGTILITQFIVPVLMLLKFGSFSFLICFFYMKLVRAFLGSIDDREAMVYMTAHPVHIEFRASR